MPPNNSDTMSTLIRAIFVAEERQITSGRLWFRGSG